MLPDTPETRLLTELSSYADDLSEAAAAMDLALEAGGESPLWPPLTGYAVVAYMRAFVHSNVRSGLLTHLEIPDDLAETHSMIRTYRNTTVAHSQSQLSLSLPLAALTAEGRVKTVVPITVRHNLPPSTASRISQAIERISALVDDLTRPLTEQLSDKYSSASPEMIATWPVPEVSQKDAEDFSAQSKRGRTPHFAVYWDVDLDGIEVVE